MFHFGIVADAAARVVVAGVAGVGAGPVLAAVVIVVVVVYAAGWRARVLRRVHLLGLIHPAGGSEDSVDTEDAGGVVDGRRKSSQLLTLLARDACRSSHSIHRDGFLVVLLGGLPYACNFLVDSCL